MVLSYFFIWDIFFCFPILFDSLWLCVCVFIMDNSPPVLFPCLGGVALCRNELYCLSLPRFWLSLRPSLHFFQPHGIQNFSPAIDLSMALKCAPCVCLLGLTGFCAWHGAGQTSLPTGSGGMVGAGCRPSASMSVRSQWCGQGAGDARSPLESSQSEKEKMASASLSASNAEGAHTNGFCQCSFWRVIQEISDPLADALLVSDSPSHKV